MNKQDELLAVQAWKDKEVFYYSKYLVVSENVKCVRYTPNRYDYYDVACKSGNTYGLMELKIREKFNLEFFLKEGNEPYLEHVKYLNMLECAKQISLSAGTDVSLYYLNFTKDLFCQVFELNKDRNFYTWQEKYLPLDDFNPQIKVWKFVTALKNPLQVIKI